MDSNHHLPPKKGTHSMTNQMSGEYMDFPTAYAFCAVPPPQAKEHLPTIHDLQFQPSSLCPKNFIVFDQTAYQSRIMFHPAIAPKFGNPGFQNYPTNVEKKDEMNCAFNEQREVSFSDKEDSDDIDALLSMEEEEEEEEEEYDEDELSTARTNGNYGSSSPDSCSSYGSKTRKLSISSLLQKSSGGGSSLSSEPKQQKMRKMVKALRGIIPGGNQMSTVTLFDEAVRYLKSLKIEAEKLGDFKD